MRRIKIAQIGVNTNSHSGQIFSRLATMSDLFELVGYALPENERERIPQKTTILEGYPEMALEEILNDPEIEAVAIETDEIYLTKYALLAAEHNKHIHMEKPGGVDLADFEKLIRMMKSKRKVFHTGYMYRYNPYVQDIMKKIKDGELGDIISVEAQMNCYHKPEIRQWLNNLPGGMMFFLGCHLIDLILQIKGMPERIIPLNKCTGKDYVTAQDFGMVVFEYPDSVSFAKTSAYELGGYARRQLVVTGTKATIELKPFEMGPEKGMYTGKTEYTSTEWPNMGESTNSDLFDRYGNMLTAFAKMVAGEMENPYTYDYELELYKVVLMSCGVKSLGQSQSLK